MFKSALLPNIAKPVLDDAKICPMPFSTPMVHALLNGTKTQTRRIVKQQPINNHNNSVIDRCSFKNGNWCFKNKIENSPGKFEITDLMKSQFDKGDIIWVRESCRFLSNGNSNPEIIITFSADNEHHLLDNDNPDLQKLLHVFPKWFSKGDKVPNGCMRFMARLFLKITNVRVERLNDISKSDAINEGLSVVDDTPLLFNNYLFNKDVVWDGYGSIKKTYGFTNPIDSFRSLWESINGKGSWDLNPYVWVYDFEFTHKPIGFI